MKKLYILFVFLLLSPTLYSQVGIGTTNPDASSALDIVSTDKGLLIPRMTSTQRGNITSSLTAVEQAAATGLQVYDTDRNSFWYFDGADWTESQADNIYSGDGILLENRIVDLNTNVLGFMNGNVGIGTNNPQRKLDVNGDVLIRGGSARITFGSATSGDYLQYQTIEGLTYYENDTSNGSSAGWKLAGSSGSNSYISSNLAIGMNVPTERLEVNGNAYINGDNIYLRGKTSSGEDGTRFAYTGGNSYIDNRGTGSIIFRNDNVTGSTTRMTIANNGNVGIGTASADASAILEMNSNDKGMLIPRMTTAERDLIATPANSLLIYNTSDQCFQYYLNASTAWFCIESSAPQQPRVAVFEKQSIQLATAPIDDVILEFGSATERINNIGTMGASHVFTISDAGYYRLIVKGAHKGLVTQGTSGNVIPDNTVYSDYFFQSSTDAGVTWNVVGGDRAEYQLYDGSPGGGGRASFTTQYIVGLPANAQIRAVVTRFGQQGAQWTTGTDVEIMAPMTNIGSKPGLLSIEYLGGL